MATRRANPRAVKLHRSYSVPELAACFGVHKDTVRFGSEKDFSHSTAGVRFYFKVPPFVRF